MLAINLDTYETARLLPWILRQSALGSVSFLDSPMAGGLAYDESVPAGRLLRASDACGWSQRRRRAAYGSANTNSAFPRLAP
jgi:hypothetical protein